MLSNSLIQQAAFSYEYQFYDLYGDVQKESHNLLGWLHGTDTLLFSEQAYNCHQDHTIARLARFFTLEAPFSSPAFVFGHTSTAPAVQVLELLDSSNNWIDVRDNCCGCGPSLSHLNFLTTTGQVLDFNGNILQTSSVSPSPDNNKIAYATSSGFDTYYIDHLSEVGTSTLIQANLDTSFPGTLFTVEDYHIRDNSIQWSPTQQHLAFITYNIYQDIHDYDRYIGLVGSNGSQPMILNTNPVIDFQWSPDGKKLLILEKDDGITIYDLETDLLHKFQSNGNPFPIYPLVQSCDGIAVSRLKAGDIAMVSLVPPYPNNLRSQADKESELLGQIQPGENFRVLNGPKCKDGYRYWYVQVASTLEYGWTAEGQFNDYFVELVP